MSKEKLKSPIENPKKKQVIILHQDKMVRAFISLVLKQVLINKVQVKAVSHERCLKENLEKPDIAIIEIILDTSDTLSKLFTNICEKFTPQPLILVVSGLPLSESIKQELQKFLPAGIFKQPFNMEPFIDVIKKCIDSE